MNSTVRDEGIKQILSEPRAGSIQDIQWLISQVRELESEINKLRTYREIDAEEIVSKVFVEGKWPPVTSLTKPFIIAFTKDIVEFINTREDTP